MSAPGSPFILASSGARAPNDRGPLGPFGADPDQPLSGADVLVVEDDGPCRRLLALLLREAGAHVNVAASAEDAEEFLAAHRPSLVVLDLILPAASGLALAEHIRRDPATRDTRIVAVTSFNGPGGERLAIEAGCNAYVQKPIDVSTFAATIASHLGE
ncbi:MAG TPA: response regulator [Polyangiaceae bacterium]|nr:response regulator [Polyangiaceae bacterium]